MVFGRYQKMLIFLLTSYVVLHGVNLNIWNFVGGHHSHWCKVDELLHLGEDQQKYIAIPYEDDSQEDFSSCDMFDLDWGNYSAEDFQVWNRSLHQGQADQCHQWVFDNTLFTSTIISEVHYKCIIIFVLLINICYVMPTEL